MAQNDPESSDLSNTLVTDSTPLISDTEQPQRPSVTGLNELNVEERQNELNERAPSEREGASPENSDISAPQDEQDVSVSAENSDRSEASPLVEEPDSEEEDPEIRGTLPSGLKVRVNEDGQVVPDHSDPLEEKHPYVAERPPYIYDRFSTIVEPRPPTPPQAWSAEDSYVVSQRKWGRKYRETFLFHQLTYLDGASKLWVVDPVLQRILRSDSLGALEQDPKIVLPQAVLLNSDGVSPLPPGTPVRNFLPALQTVVFQPSGPDTPVPPYVVKTDFQIFSELPPDDEEIEHNKPREPTPCITTEYADCTPSDLLKTASWNTGSWEIKPWKRCFLNKRNE